MKLLIIAISLLTLNAFAVENWFPVSKSGAKTVYMKKADCEATEGQACFDITGKDIRYHDIQTVQVDDETNPIWKAPYKSASCDDQEDCMAKIATATQDDPCDSGDTYKSEKNAVLPGYTYYCTKLEGYAQINVQSLVENSTNKAAVEAADAAETTLNSQLAAKYKDMAFGKRVIALFTLKSDAKSLSSTQRAQLANDFETIKRLLEAGSIQAARDTMASITPDGTLVTAQDKTDVLAELDSYLAP